MVRATYAPRGRTLLAAGIIAVAGLLAYSNTFTVPEILDDPGSISQNPHIRQVWPITEAMKSPPQKTTAGRPVLCASLAVNYAISGLDVWSYHAFNLTVHVIAALLLFGIVRRTLAGERLRHRFGRVSRALAFICALLWVLHPLQTQAVTYMIQRAESMMGMFYLLGLYCAIRAFTSPHSLRWYTGSVISCALGMGTKEVMVTAPLMILIYERIFIARSFWGLLKRRWGYYLALSATWIILGAILITAPRSRTAGFELEAVTPLQYALTQPGVILHYLRLAIWPDPLVLDYAWPLAENLSEILIPSAVIALLLVGTIAGLRYAAPLGFLGVWFFLILAPSSSFVPIKDAAFEHRMYLSLAAVLVGVLACGYYLMVRISGQRRGAAELVGLVLCLIAAGLSGRRTYQRNKEYTSELSIWLDTLAKVPHNPRAHGNLAFAYAKARSYEKALYHYDKLIELNPKYPKGHNERGVLYAMLGKYDLAMREFNTAIALDTRFAPPYRNRGMLWARRGGIARAMEDYDTAIRLKPDFAKAYLNRTEVHIRRGRFQDAIADSSKAIALRPDIPDAHRARARAYTKTGRYDLALGDLDEAIHLDPRRADTYNNRAIVYHKLGRDELAIADCTSAVALNPGYAAPYVVRGIALARVRRYERAIRDFDKALAIDPRLKEAYRNKANLLAHLGREAELIDNWRKAVRNKGEWEEALRSLAWVLASSRDDRLRNGEEAVGLARRAVMAAQPPSPESLDALGGALGETGRFHQAVLTAETALAAAQAARNHRLAREIAARIELYKTNRPYRLPKGKADSVETAPTGRAESRSATVTAPAESK